MEGLAGHKGFVGPFSPPPPLCPGLERAAASNLLLLTLAFLTDALVIGLLQCGGPVNLKDIVFGSYVLLHTIYNI